MIGTEYPSTIGKWWQMGEWSGRELLVFKKFHLLPSTIGQWLQMGEWSCMESMIFKNIHLLGGVCELADLRVIDRLDSHQHYLYLCLK